MSKTTLLPCPFCGQQPTEYAIEPHTHVLQFAGGKMPDHQGSHVIECACGCGMIEATRDAVIARWSLRASACSTSSSADAMAEAIERILEEAKRATQKFPTWPTDPLHALAILGEEFGELTKDMLQLTYEPHKTNKDRVRTEAIQTAAMALRLFQSLNHYKYRPSKQHSQEVATGEWPRLGDLVRYGDGSTALALHGAPHAGGWHGVQCMGGHTFYTSVYRPTNEDREKWADCAVRYRNKSTEEGRREAGLENFHGSADT